MKVEIKNVKHSQFASHETNCFEATVYIDGKRMGTVSNDGQGGPNDYDSRALVEALTKYAKTLPTRTWKLDDQVLEVHPDMDTAIDDLLMAHLYSRDLKRAMTKRILFVDKDGILKQTGTMDKARLAQRRTCLSPAQPRAQSSVRSWHYCLTEANAMATMTAMAASMASR